MEIRSAEAWQAQFLGKRTILVKYIKDCSTKKDTEKNLHSARGHEKQLDKTRIMSQGERQKQRNNTQNTIIAIMIAFKIFEKKYYMKTIYLVYKHNIIIIIKYITDNYLISFNTNSPSHPSVLIQSIPIFGGYIQLFSLGPNGSNNK